MGTGCSKSVVVVSANWKPEARSSASNASTTATGSTIKTLAEATIWSPFKLSRSEAEELLSRAEPGAFVFSHDMTSELFLSICVGKYVCHHAVLARDQGYYVGARKFTTISDVVDYFKDHPLGEITLKQEFRTLPKCTSHVQIRHHPDITIPSPPAITETEQLEPLEKNQSSSAVQSSCAFQTKSPKITFTSQFVSADQRSLSDQYALEPVPGDTDENELLIVKRRKDTPITTRKKLTRAMAVDKAESSGEFQETPLSPLLSSRSPEVKS